MTYGHGDDTYRYGGEVKINFSSNLYQKADLTELKAFLASRLDMIRNYPEPEPRELEDLVASRLNLPANMVMVTNGANEAIYLIAQLYGGWASIIPQPTYNEYADACRLFNHTISYEHTETLDLLPEDRIYWICNPNNPTGNVLLKPLLSHLIRKHPRYLYVIDQSYADYTMKTMLEPHEMMDCYNVMIIQSLSKKYCIPGLRLGYVTGSPVIINRLRQIRQPWTVNAMAIEAGKYLLEKDPVMLPDLQTYLTETRRLKQALDAIDGLMVMDTETNFMLVHIDWADTQELKSWLMEHYGMLIRDASNFHGLDNHCFRVAAQSPKENDALVAALLAYKQEKQE